MRIRRYYGHMLIPEKMHSGDEVRVIAPARSMGIISTETQEIANQRLADLGLQVTFGKHIHESDLFASSSIESRLADLHEAFRDPNVKAILTVIGGYNSNQLLERIDWELIIANPKILCGYSDITILQNAIFAKTGLVTYSGPHYSSFGQKKHFDYTLDCFKKCLFSDETFFITPSTHWSDDRWFINQDERELIPNLGWHPIHSGAVEGTLLGANLGTFNLLRGTDYFPSLDGAILLCEDDDIDGAAGPMAFDRNLQSLIQQPRFEGVRGLIIGRFQKGTGMTREKLAAIIESKPALRKLPVIADVDFGHTDPKVTLPIGGTIRLTVGSTPAIEILKH